MKPKVQVVATPKNKAISFRQEERRDSMFVGVIVPNVVEGLSRLHKMYIRGAKSDHYNHANDVTRVFTIARLQTLLNCHSSY